MFPDKANALASNVFLSALLLTTISDVIRGVSIDLFAPLLNALLPGDAHTPVKVFNMKLYPTRFAIRLFNFLLAYLVVKQLTKSY